MGEVVALPKSDLPERTLRFLRWARETAERKPEMAGFVILAWDEDGATTLSADLISDDSPIPRALVPSWVAEIIRRDLVTEGEVERQLRDIGILAPTPPDQPA